jgi:hypothetical protein
MLICPKKIVPITKAVLLALYQRIDSRKILDRLYRLLILKTGS